MKNAWQVIHECDMEDGTPTHWAKRVDHPKYGKFAWISLCGDREYAVEVIPGDDIKELVICKSLSSAKRWVKINIG